MSFYYSNEEDVQGRDYGGQILCKEGMYRPSCNPTRIHCRISCYHEKQGFFSTCNTKCSTVAWTNLCVADFISLNCRLKLFIVFHMSIKRTCSLEKYACSSSSRASSSSLALFQSAVSFWISRVSCWLAEVACSSWSRSMLLTCWRLALLKKVTHAWAGSGKEFSSSTSLHFLHKIQTCISNVIQKIQYTQSFTVKGCCFAKCCIYNHLRPSAQFSNQIIHVKVAWFQARQQTFPKCNQALRMFWKMYVLCIHWKVASVSTSTASSLLSKHQLNHSSWVLLQVHDEQGSLSIDFYIFLKHIYNSI